MAKSNSNQAMWVAMGTMFAYAFTLVSSMILSRYFDKADYGTYRQVMYVYHTLLFIFTLGLPKAFSYFLPRMPMEQGRDLVRKITMMFLCMGLVFSLILYAGAEPIASVIKNESLVPLLRMFSPVPLLLLPTLGVESIYASYRKTKFTAFYHVSRSFFMLACVCVPVIFYKTDVGVAIQGFVISSVCCFLLAIYMQERLFVGLENVACDISYGDVFRYSLPLMTASLWGTLIKSTDQFFISRYCGTEVFAEYSNGFIELPFIGMVVGACSTVLFPLISRLDNEKADPREVIFPIWINVFKKTSMILYPLLCICWVFADDVMTLMYGAKYANCGIYFQICQIANVFTVIAFGPILLATGQTKVYSRTLMYNFVLVVCLEFCIVMLCPSPVFIAIASTACHILRCLFQMYYVARYMRVRLIDLFPKIFMAKILVPSLILLFCLQLIVNVDDIILRLIISLGVYGMLYLVWAKIAGIDYLRAMKQTVK